MGRTRRVSNTSGTIILAEYKSATIPSSPDLFTAPTYTYNNFSTAYSTNIQARHPALPPTPGGNGSGTTGLLNVAFVDGHVQTMDVVTISPATAGAGDAFWNNGGASRQD